LAFTWPLLARLLYLAFTWPLLGCGKTVTGVAEKQQCCKIATRCGKIATVVKLQHRVAKLQHICFTWPILGLYLAVAKL
jgi:hypothetical protein